MLRKLKQGYARLLDVAAAALDRPGLTFVETPVRNQPEWANWVQPVWLFAIDSAVVCSVAPEYAAQAEEAFDGLSVSTILSQRALAAARTVIDKQDPRAIEWVQCDLFAYLQPHPPTIHSSHTVERLRPGDERANRFLRQFDGGVFGVRVEGGFFAAHAFVKDKGGIQEIAVGTEPGYRRRGLGRAVVAGATSEILKRGRVPIYWPDSRQNIASYALVESVGFQKVAAMLFCSYELPDWPGFSLYERW